MNFLRQGNISKSVLFVSPPMVFENVDLIVVRKIKKRSSGSFDVLPTDYIEKFQ
jgi:hypothetical protein